MRVRIDSVVPPAEPEDFGLEVDRVFAELGSQAGTELLTGVCAPPVDVYETDDALELAVDLPGVPASAIRILVKGEFVLIAGQKRPDRADGRPSFHVLEREYGRFARTIRLAAAVDPRRARATLTDGELRLALPKLLDRRGIAIPVPISSAPARG
jgi:HSP20 family protein